jgi:hypothetical protein
MLRSTSAQRLASSAASDRLTSGFSFFGGAAQSVLLDNMKLAVVRMLPDETRSGRRHPRG